MTVYSNATLLGRIRIGEGATICGNVWITEDVPAGVTVSQQTVNKCQWTVSEIGEQRTINN